MLAGNIPGKTGTISQKIAMVIQDGDYATAGVWVAIVMLIAFLVIFSMEFYIRHKDEEYQTLVAPVKQHTASSVCCLSCQAYDKKKLWMENAWDWDCTGNCGKMREG